MGVVLPERRIGRPRVPKVCGLCDQPVDEADGFRRNIKSKGKNLWVHKTCYKEHGGAEPADEGAARFTFKPDGDTRRRCTKCNKPIELGEEQEHSRKLFHKHCVPNYARPPGPWRD